MIGFRDSLRSSLLSLFNVAYNSRCSLPLLISVGFMLLDLHMRLELEIEANVVQEPEGEQEVDLNSNDRSSGGEEQLED
jgi:hypothetical protein